MNLEWVQDFFESIKGRIQVRQEDKVLILPPNQVYSLNDTALKLLLFLMQGGRVEELIERAGGSEKVARDIENFFSALRQLVAGRAEEGPHPAIEYVPYRKEFYTYPVLSEFAVTYRCNLRCSFCYLPDMSSFRELSTRRAKEVLRILKEEARLSFVSFTGGEPLLREDLEELVAFAEALGLKTNLITNATLISRERAASLAAAGLRSAQVSLESPDEKIHNLLTGSDSFRATLAGIENLLEQGIYLHTNTTLNRLNAETMVSFPAFIKSLGLRKFSANIIIPVGRARKNPHLHLSYREIGSYIERIKEAAEKEGVEFVWYSPLPYCIYNPVQKGLGAKSCAACHGLASVDPEGYLLPCSSYPERVGNILEEGFERVWFSSRALYFRKMEYLPQRCRSCHLVEICAGACPLYWEAAGYGELEEKR